MQLAEDINFTTEKKELLSEKIHDEILELIIKNASEEEQVLMQGVIDCCFTGPEGLTVVDFKTDRVDRRSVAARAEEYRPQLEAYAQALERVMEEKVCRKVLYFFSTGATINL